MPFLEVVMAMGSMVMAMGSMVMVMGSMVMVMASIVAVAMEMGQHRSHSLAGHGHQPEQAPAATA